MGKAAALLLVGMALLASPAGAVDPGDLPPGEPQQAFAAEYRIERNQGGRFEWGRRRLFLAGPLLRDDLLDGDVDRASLLADRQRSSLLRFDPDDPARLVRRLPWNEARLPLIAQGYAGVMDRLGPPRLVGERHIAGHDCVRLVWEAVGEKQEWCVTSEGLVLAARRLAGVNETKVEVMLLELSPPDPSLFAPPPGFVVVD